MNTRWPVVPLSKVLRQDTTYIDVPELRQYPKLSVKLYGKGVVLDAPVDGAFLKMQRHQLARTGQVILSEIWGKKGAIGLVPKEGDGALCTSHFFLFDVLNEHIETPYLRYVFAANLLEPQLNSEARGTTGYAAVRPKHLLNCEIPLPPLVEQRRIVARIEDLAVNIDLALTLRRQSGERAAALSASHANLIFAGPCGSPWPTRPLGDVADIRSGVTLGRRLTGKTISLPYLRVANVQDGYLDLGEIKWVDVLEHETDKWTLMDGDLLLTEGGDWDKLGRAAIWRNNIPSCIHQNHIFRVRLRGTDLHPEFVAALIGSPVGKAYFQAASKQTTNLASINQRQLKAFPVPIPPVSEQLQVVAEMTALKSQHNDLKRLQAETGAQLDALMPAILDCAFRGEL